MKPKATEMYFDDMETFEHTKMKPVSIGLAVSSERRILGFYVCKMPAKGLLAERSRKKYGRRADERTRSRNILFRDLKPLISKDCLIKSDESPHYSLPLRRHFPRAQHKTFKGRKGCVVGQGELKKIGFDPLFALNHTCAVLRARVSRLIRRSWNTTKDIEMLRLHLAMACYHHNQMLCRIGRLNVRGQFLIVQPATMIP